MSFVHCPSCHRAYDLRRQASCPACRQRDEAKHAAKVAQAEAAVAAAPVVVAAAPATAPVVVAAALATAPVAFAAAPATAPVVVAAAAFADGDVADGDVADGDVADSDVRDGDISDADLEPFREPPREQRIVAMVEELAALLERATSAELEAARAQLHQRGLRAPWTAQLTSGGRFLLAAGEKLVTSAMRAPQQGARKLARRLRDAWSGGASPRL